jgi:hypothetical protein
MSGEDWKAKYDNIICSACPFCKESLAKNFPTHIPCDLWNGGLYHLALPWMCAMLPGNLDEEELFQKVKEKGGEDSLKRFKQKIILLKNKE